MPVSAGEVDVGVVEAGAAEEPAGAVEVPPVSAGLAAGAVVAGASERGTGWFGPGAPPFTTSPATLLSLAAGLSVSVACLRTSVALTGFGSTRLGSPTCAASLMSGRLRKFAIMRSK